MERKLLKVKGRFEGKRFKVSHVKISKEVAEHALNAKLGLQEGYNPVPDGDGCKGGCPADTNEGYYVCVSNNCVFVPYG